jgi:precorrin-2 dehydrogenase/sirohydrochlorin ferrochelatase
MNIAADNPYFQVGIDVADRPCLVIGGGAEAEDKSARLLEAKAHLVVVSARVTPQLESSAQEGRLIWHERLFRMDDLDGKHLVVNTVGDDLPLAEKVYERACQTRLLINSFDQPQYSNFGMAALVHPGPLRISISTSNASPALASRLRQDLEQLFDDEFVEFVTQLKRVRQKLRQQMDDRPARMELLRSLVTDFRLEGKLSYPEGWRRRLAGFLADE